MAKVVHTVNLKGQKVGEVHLDDRLVNAECHPQLIKDYIVAIRANRRQWSANTKGRSEVQHSTKKPHAQKGTGRARQGSLAAPQYKGGGRVFGPKPKFDQHVRVNKKARRAVIRALIAEKIRDDRFIVLDSMQMGTPRTKEVQQFLDSQGVTKGMGMPVLFLAEGSFAKIDIGEQAVRLAIASQQHDAFIKSMRNIPRAQFCLAQNVNGYQVMCAGKIVISEKSLAELQQWLLIDEEGA